MAVNYFAGKEQHMTKGGFFFCLTYGWMELHMWEKLKQIAEWILVFLKLLWKHINVLMGCWVFVKKNSHFHHAYLHLNGVIKTLFTSATHPRWKWHIVWVDLFFFKHSHYPNGSTSEESLKITLLFKGKISLEMYLPERKHTCNMEKNNIW